MVEIKFTFNNTIKTPTAYNLFQKKMRVQGATLGEIYEMWRVSDEKKASEDEICNNLGCFLNVYVRNLEFSILVDTKLFKYIYLHSRAYDANLEGDDLVKIQVGASQKSKSDIQNFKEWSWKNSKGDKITAKKDKIKIRICENDCCFEFKVSPAVFAENFFYSAEGIPVRKLIKLNSFETHFIEELKTMMNYSDDI